MTKPPFEMYGELRQLALNTRAADLGFTDLDSRSVFGVLMDMSIDGDYATIVAFLTGDASIYLSTGGGFTGGGGRGNVAETAINFVKVASNFLGAATLGDAVALPASGMTKFSILTPSGIFSTEDQDEELNKKRSELFPLFSAGHGIVVAYRQIENSPRDISKS